MRCPRSSDRGSWSSRRLRANRAFASRRRASGWEPSPRSSLRWKLFAGAAVFYLALAGAFFFISHHRAHDAAADQRLPRCGATTLRGACIRSERGKIVDRYVSRRQQHLVVAFAAGDREIQLSSDGWAGDWRGRFPIGEPVRIDYRGGTPLAVYEPDGHRRQTADNPSGDATFFFFIAWVFLVGALPFAYAIARWPQAIRSLSSLGRRVR